MDILLISPFFGPNVGGVETHLDDLSKYLRIRGHHVYVITYQPLTTNVRGTGVERSNSLEIRRISWFGHALFHKLEPYPFLEFIYLTPMLFLYSLLFMLTHRPRINVIHGHGMNANFIAAILARVFKIRSVGTLHTIYRLKDRMFLAKLSKIALSKLDAILVVSNKAKEELVSVGLDPAKISVFRYWIDLSVFKPLDKMAYKSRLGLSGKLVALFVGRFLPSKGVPIVLEAASMLSNNLIFLFVGEGPLRDQIDSLASKVNNVLLIGKIPNMRLPQYYNAADVLVWGNLDMDYIGRVAIEALSCGLPIIAPKEVSLFGVARNVSLGDTPDSIVTLVAPNGRSLAQKLVDFTRNSERLAQISTICRLFAVEHYSEKNGDVILRTYRET